MPPSSASESGEKARRRDGQARERFEAAAADARQGRLPAARSALRALVAENPSARPFRAYLHYVTGRMHEAAGRTSEAVVEYDRALSFDPELDVARQAKEEHVEVDGGPGDGPARDGAGRFGRWFRK